MKFNKINFDTEPKITGSKNGVYSVEIKEKYSFASLEDKTFWKGYTSENRKNRKRVLLSTYMPLKTSLLSNPIIFFSIGKRIKQLDFMAFSPYEHGIQFLITKRVYDILSKYRMPVHNKIPAKIDTFEQEYFLLGIPMVDSSEIDFSKSRFYNYNDGKTENFKDFNDYKEADYNRKMSTPQILNLKNKLNFDAIKTTKGVFFSSEIIEEFKKENISGYRIEEGILEN